MSESPFSGLAPDEVEDACFLAVAFTLSEETTDLQDSAELAREEIVKRREERGDGPLARCKNGHVRTLANTYIDKKGYRHCRTCRK